MLCIGEAPQNVTRPNYLTMVNVSLSSYSGKVILLSFIDFVNGWDWLHKLISIQNDTRITGISSNVQIVAVVYRYMGLVNRSQLLSKINADPLLAGKINFPVLIDGTWVTSSACMYLGGFSNMVDPLYHGNTGSALNSYMISKDYLITDKWHPNISAIGDPSSFNMIPPTGTFNSAVYSNAEEFAIKRIVNLNAAPSILYSIPSSGSILPSCPSVQLVFSKLMSGAGNVSNYSIAGIPGLSISGASFSGVGLASNVVTLSISGVPSLSGTLTVSASASVTDTAGTPIPSALRSVSYTIDVSAPAVSSFTLTSLSPSTDPNITFSLTAFDNIGIAGYCVNESSLQPSSGDPGWQSAAPSSYTLSSGTGTKTVYAWVKDTVGNVSSLTPSSMFSVFIEDPDYLRKAESIPMIPSDEAWKDRDALMPEMSVVTSASTGYSIKRTVSKKKAAKKIRQNDAPIKKSAPKRDKKKAVKKDGARRSGKIIRVGVKKIKKNAVKTKPVKKSAAVKKTILRKKAVRASTKVSKSRVDINTRKKPVNKKSKRK